MLPHHRAPSLGYHCPACDVDIALQCDRASDHFAVGIYMAICAFPSSSVSPFQCMQPVVSGAAELSYSIGNATGPRHPLPSPSPWSLLAKGRRRLGWWRWPPLTWHRSHRTTEWLRTVTWSICGLIWEPTAARRTFNSRRRHRDVADWVMRVWVGNQRRVTRGFTELSELSAAVGLHIYI
jgi:hypothetical protein